MPVAETVLVAEDEPGILFVLELFIRKWGFEFIGTGDGREAWRILQAPDAPHLVILDWQLPGMNGLEICRAIRKRDSMTYIVMLTARSQQADIQLGMDAGVNRYLVKPFEPEELRCALLAGCALG